MARREREILEHAVHTIAEQAVKADELVDEAKAAGGGDHPVTVHAKMLRLELLKVKADLERELEDFVLKLLDVRPGCSLGERTRRVTGALGAPGARTARGAEHLSLCLCQTERMPRSDTRNTAAGESSIVDAAIWFIAIGAIVVTLWYSLGAEPPGPASDKDLHGVAYFVNTLALLFAVVWRPGREARRLRDWSIPIAAGVLAAGGLIEIAQGAFAGRDAQVTDWVADAVGVALALLTFTLLRRGWKAASSI